MTRHELLTRLEQLQRHFELVGRTGTSHERPTAVLDALALSEARAALSGQGSERAWFAAGIAAAEHAVAELSASGRSHDFALGLAAAGEAIHGMDQDEAFAVAEDLPEPAPPTEEN